MLPPCSRFRLPGSATYSRSIDGHIQVSLPAPYGDAAKAAARGGDVGVWAAGVLRHELVTAAAAAAGQYDADHDDPAFEADRLTGQA